MSKLFGCLINEAQLVPHALCPFRSLLSVSETESPFGWGLAHHYHQDVLIKRRPRHMGALDFYRKVQDMNAHAIIGDVRTLAEGRTVPEDTQPFRFRSWTAAHSGNLARFEQIRPWIVNSIPNFLRRNIQGVTDSEHLFHLFLAFLYDDGVLDAYDLPTELIAKAMRNTFRTVDRFVTDAGEGESQMNMVVTNGRVMVMAADTQPVYHAQLSGLHDCELCRQPPESWNSEPKCKDHDNLKCTLMVLDPPDNAKLVGLTRVEPGNLVAADQDFKVFTLPMVD